jgi:transposase
MGRALEIRTDVATAGELRRLARREGCRRTATRMLAIAHALDGLSRAEAARLVGLERQALRDAVARYNAEELAGLADRPRPGRPPTLSEGEQAVLVATILRGPDPERDGGVEWTLPMLCHWIEGRFSTSACTRRACRAWCEAWICRAIRPGRGTRRPTRPPRQPSQKGALPRGSRGRSRPSGPTDRAVVPR